MIKMKFFILFLSIISIFCINIGYADNNELSLLGKVIYIDPGHGDNLMYWCDKNKLKVL